jgi:DNA modification methylase
MSPDLNKIFQGKCEDPPFNIGLPYSLYDDQLPYTEYVNWSRRWINECVRVLKPNGSMYVFIGDDYAAEIKVLLRESGLKFRNWLCWYFKFGQSQRRKFNRCHTHILYYTKSATDFTFNAADILVPSARQLTYNDKRAKAGGKVPDDIWEVYARDVDCRPDELRLYPEDLELWTDPRLCGTFNERLNKADGSAHPCQLPLSLLRRIIKASSNKRDLVVDCFSGTGTTAYAAAELERNFITMEMDPEYVKVGRERLSTLGVQA